MDVQGTLLVALKREDVVLPGDLALRKAVQTAYGLDHRPSRAEVLAIAEKWRPSRGLAAGYLFPPPSGRRRPRGSRPDAEPGRSRAAGFRSGRAGSVSWLSRLPPYRLPDPDSRPPR